MRYTPYGNVHRRIVEGLCPGIWTEFNCNMVFRRTKKPVLECDQTKSNRSSADIRILREFTDLDIPDFVSITFDDVHRKATMKITPSYGFWKQATFVFAMSIPSTYPWDGITCLCLTPIVHPNIDRDGHICLSILRPWNPTYTIQTVVFGLILLLLEPNANDPLNLQAGLEIRENPERFQNSVDQCILRNKSTQ